MSKFDFEFAPRFDLTFERTVDVKPEIVWAAWTQPHHIVHWFTPAPWKTIHCEIDLRPGGLFRTVMQSPDGQEFPGDGCYLDVVENQRLVWTSALGPGYRPTSESGPDAMMFTGVILMEPSG
jgi:uncharacterized protein YndB with AHSA1/START domain